MESTKLSARVTAYRDAISAARDAGVTWGQLAALFNADAKYFAAVCKTMAGGRYKAGEQLPLPEVQVPQQHARVVPHHAAASPAVQQQRPLPGSSSLPPGASRQTADVAELERLGVKVHN